MIIRPAAPEDLAAINAVHSASGRSEWTAQMLADEHRLVAIAVVDGIVVGAGKTHFFADDDGAAPAGHYLGGVTVHPDHRRLGAGTALTRVRMDWVWSRADRVFYFTDDHNLASILMHETLGFEEIGRAPVIRRRHADRPGGDLVLFRADRR